MSLKRFLISKSFFINLFIILVAGFVLTFITLLLLKNYTKHSEEYALPNYKGMTIKELKKNHLNKGFTFFITDSVYNQDEKPGTIISQNPLSGSMVKKGRNVYLTIVASNPEEVVMPNLVDLSLRQSISILKSKGLQIGKLIYVENMAHNAVLEQYFEGKPIESGQKVFRNSYIDLKLGIGRNSSPTKVPELIGKTRKEARELLHQYSLNVGKEHYLNSNDEKRVKVYKTTPSHYKYQLLNLGTAVDLYYRDIDNYNFNKKIEEMRNQISLDTISVE